MTLSLRLLLTILPLAVPAAAATQRNASGAGPAPLAELGVLSREAQPIGDPSLGAFSERYNDGEWHYLETPHFRIASSLRAIKLSAKDKKRLATELEALGPYFPELGSRPKALPPEVYIVLMGTRLERLYVDFQTLAGVKDDDFPASRAAQNGEGPYMGDGPYLGEREKFEVVLHRQRFEHSDFTKWQRGIEATDTVRWHNRTPSKLLVSMPCVDGDLREDRWLWPHLAHNVAHMMLDGYKLFAYDPPLWLAEGIALWFEKRIEPMSFTRDGGEGVFFEPDRSSDWTKEIQKLAKRGKHTPIATLLAARGPDDLDKTGNVTTWSVTQFLIEQHSVKYAAFLGAVKGQLDERGFPSGRDLRGLQRTQLRELWGWTPKELEEAWLKWILGEGKR